MKYLVYIFSFILAILSFVHFSGAIDMSIAISLIALSAFIFVIEDIAKKQSWKTTWNFTATFLLFLALIVPYFQSYLTEKQVLFLSNLSDLVTVLSVSILIIFKTVTESKIDKDRAELEALRNGLQRVYTASEIQNELKIGEKAFIFTEGDFKNYIIERRENNAIFWKDS
ncbi:hypothetical protein ABEY24_20640 [Peribacillus frigoritolerans]|uniref:hypothetical protein n=1 Tax=Peribacillus frigoritolerans TaxID=450367 RepID=UPI003D2C9D7A